MVIGWLLNIKRSARTVPVMKKLSFIMTCMVCLTLAAPAQAADCYADYKAKQDKPLRLHYGVIKVQGACKRSSARAELSARLKRQGWTLLNVMSVFGDEGLAERRGNAGSFYLRY